MLQPNTNIHSKGPQWFATHTVENGFPPTPPSIREYEFVSHDAMITLCKLMQIPHGSPEDPIKDAIKAGTIFKPNQFNDNQNHIWRVLFEQSFVLQYENTVIYDVVLSPIKDSRLNANMLIAGEFLAVALGIPTESGDDPTAGPDDS